MESALKLIQSCDYCGLNFSPVKDEKYCCEACERLHVGFSVLEQVQPSKQKKYLYLDQSEIQKKYQIGTEREFLFHVEGLQCSSCVHLIEKIPDYYHPCEEIRVNFGTALAQVKLSVNAELSMVALMLEELGYKATIVTSSEVSQQIGNKVMESNRLELKRIAIAAVCASNIMIFSIAIYAGATGFIHEFFRWASFLLFLPVLLYSAQSFYVGAVNAIRYKVLHIDLPIVIALISGFIFSTYNLFRGTDDFYFDSTAGFLFLILSSRYLIRRTQQKYLSPLHIKSLIKDQFYRLQNGKYIAIDDIKAGDHLVIECGQSLPVDGKLESEYALIDTAFFNGETNPKTFNQGQSLFAGYKVISKEMNLAALASLKESKIHSLFDQTTVNVMKKSHYLNLSDRLAQKLILSVLLISLIFFTVYGLWTHDFYTAFNRVLALIVVACPCALAFGSPLTLAMAYRKAFKKGIALRSPDVFEKLQQVKNICFDKTGTLTEGKLKLVYSYPEVINTETQRIILSLERISYHPVAFAFRSIWASTSHQLPIVASHEENLGLGVSGFIGPDFYELRGISQNMHEDDLAVELLKNGESKARFYFSDELQENTKETIQSLNRKKMNLYLLTGDKKSKALKVAGEVGIEAGHVQAELFPEDKEKFISERPFSLMIGDGVNDTLALSRAYVGIAVHGSSLFTLHSSDVYFLKNGLSPLLELFKINKTTHRVLIRNLSIALIYNLLAGAFALMGYINPLWAAVLMPMSTFIILISTLWGFAE